MIGDRVRLAKLLRVSAPHELQGEGMIASEFHDSVCVKFGSHECWCNRAQVELVSTDYPVLAPQQPEAESIEE